MLFGPAYKGITLAGATAMMLAEDGLDIPFAFNRKEAKDHGEGRRADWRAAAGRVLIIDDVISAGTSVRESVELIRAHGATPGGGVDCAGPQERGKGELSAVQEKARLRHAGGGHRHAGRFARLSGAQPGLWPTTRPRCRLTATSTACDERAAVCARRLGAPALAALAGCMARRRWRVSPCACLRDWRGGVGSWAAEALARSAIGELTLIDLDHVARPISTARRIALSDTLGMAKVDAMAERLLQINPQLVIHRVDEFIEPDTVGQLLSTQLDYVVDAIDSLRAKAALIAWCRRRHKVPVVVSSGAGGKTDPPALWWMICRTTDDPMASKLRYTLRRQHGFARDGKFGVPRVFSTEPDPPSAACEAGGWRSGFELRRVWFGDGGDRWFWSGGGQPGARDLARQAR